jgi:GNAT superfamily N-acetyltransferase
VRDVLADSTQRVWVSEDAGERAIGFVAATLHREQELGEIYLIAVDPGAQGQGIGTALTRVATDWLRQSGMRVAMIETGGDRGHAPARRLYEKAGYTSLPAVRFFKARAFCWRAHSVPSFLASMASISRGELRGASDSRGRRTAI